MIDDIQGITLAKWHWWPIQERLRANAIVARAHDRHYSQQLLNGANYIKAVIGPHHYSEPVTVDISEALRDQIYAILIRDGQRYRAAMIRPEAVKSWIETPAERAERLGASDANIV